MKEIHIIGLLCIVLCSNSCKINRDVLQLANPEERVSETIHLCVEDFYNIYLRFPQSIDELNEFIWHIISSTNGFKYKSFQSYLESEKINSHYVEANCFLIKNKDNIKLKSNNDKIVLFFNGKRLEVKKNICEDLKLPLDKSKFIYRLNSCETFDLDGKITQKHYEDEFLRLLKLVKDQVRQKESSYQKANFTYSAFQYNKHSGLSSICHQTDINIENNPYLKALSLAVDTFIQKRGISSINFIIQVPSINNESRK